MYYSTMRIVEGGVEYEIRFQDCGGYGGPEMV